MGTVLPSSFKQRLIRSLRRFSITLWETRVLCEQKFVNFRWPYPGSGNTHGNPPPRPPTGFPAPSAAQELAAEGVPSSPHVDKTSSALLRRVGALPSSLSTRWATPQAETKAVGRWPLGLGSSRVQESAPSILLPFPNHSETALQDKSRVVTSLPSAQPGGRWGVSAPPSERKSRLAPATHSAFLELV